MDEADRVEAAEEKFREQSLKYREPELLSVGACYYCNSILGSGKTFSATKNAAMTSSASGTHKSATDTNQQKRKFK